MLRSTKARLALGGVLLVLLVAAAWAAWQAWQVEKALSASVRDANAVSAAVSDGDRDEIARRLADLEQDSRSAERRTSGFTWSVLAHAPVFGDDARGVRTMSQVLADLARDGVSPLAHVSGEADSLLPHGGSIDLEALRALQPSVDRARAAFAAADSRLATLDPSGFIGPLRTKYDDFRTKVDQGARAMRATDTAVGMLPAMLGSAGPRDYLLIFQNNAEIRATGGLPGAVARIHAADGRLTMTGQTSGGAIGGASRPVLPLDKAERTLYGDVFGSDFRDANFTPDVPRAAALFRARWQQVHPKDRVDGVILVDTVSLGYVLDATGPLDVDGVHLTGDNLAEELLSKAYARLSRRQQDVFFADVARAAFDRFTTGASNATGVVRALSRAASEGRVYAHSFDPALQARIAGSQIAGDLLSNAAEDRPQVAITVNDTTGSKMSYYLRYQVDASATYCTGGVQGLSVKAHLQSTAPADAATSLPRYVTGSGDVRRGDDLVTLRIFGPLAGRIGQLTWNDQPMRLIRTTEDGRPVAMTYIELKPGQIVDLGWTMVSGPGQTGDTDLVVTPTIQRSDALADLPSAC